MSKIKEENAAVRFDACMTVAEVCELYRCCRNTIAAMEKTGMLPARFKVGPRAVRFSRAEVMARMAQRHAEAQAKAERARVKRAKAVWVDEITR